MSYLFGDKITQIIVLCNTKYQLFLQYCILSIVIVVLSDSYKLKYFFIFYEVFSFTDEMVVLERKIIVRYHPTHEPAELKTKHRSPFFLSLE